MKVDGRWLSPTKRSRGKSSGQKRPKNGICEFPGGHFSSSSGYVFVVSMLLFQGVMVVVPFSYPGLSLESLESLESESQSCFFLDICNNRPGRQWMRCFLGGGFKYIFFPPLTWRNDPILTNLFQLGLKPPTSFVEKYTTLSCDFVPRQNDHLLYAFLLSIILRYTFEKRRWCTQKWTLFQKDAQNLETTNFQVNHLS